MEHILTQCPSPGQSELWAEAKKLWAEKGRGPWPEGNLLGVALAAGIMRYKKSNGKRDLGAERFFQILGITTLISIWRLRCLSTIGRESEGREPGTPNSTDHVRRYWWKAMTARLELDQALTHPRLDEHALPRKVVLDTWSKVITHDPLPEGKDWIGTGRGVLVGSPPPIGGRRNRRGEG
ncbi:hypothetical protein PENSPDRAFT_588409 [Peniophora sp. CONT]|nr:hypothetical protein PENSPDRAFT_588409 [Peniophora sp. CONT]